MRAYMDGVSSKTALHDIRGLPASSVASELANQTAFHTIFDQRHARSCFTDRNAVVANIQMGIDTGLIV